MISIIIQTAKHKQNIMHPVESQGSRIHSQVSRIHSQHLRPGEHEQVSRIHSQHNATHSYLSIPSHISGHCMF
jgi:hypothetical protein